MATKKRLRQTNRREFLRGALCAAGAFASPAIIPGSALGAGETVAPSNRIAMGFIGVGGQGGGHVRSFTAHSDVQSLATCDVRDSAAQRGKGVIDGRYGNKACATYRDFRELLARPDIDAVLIAVPDHWHVLVGLEAARQGKDMYLEKPMGRTVAEGKAMREAVHRYGVVFQFGTQQRSQRYYRQTYELVRNGKIGELKTIMVASWAGHAVPLPAPQTPPAGFDYDMWLGPAPWVPYSPERCTRDFTLIADYSLGCLGGAWGVHDVDIAQWVNGQTTMPVEVEGAGVYPANSLFDSVLTWEVEHRYPNGVRLIHMDRERAMQRAEQFKLLRTPGMLFVGTEGWILVSRDRLFMQPESLQRLTFGPNDVRLPPFVEHRRGFLDAVKARGTPISPIDGAVCADFVCQQADIAMRLGRKLRWDPVQEVFQDDDEANRMLARTMRSPWRL